MVLWHMWLEPPSSLRFSPLDAAHRRRRRLPLDAPPLHPPQVISNRMQKSVLVAVDRLVKHKKYDRLLRRTTKLMVRSGAAAGGVAAGCTRRPGWPAACFREGGACFCVAVAPARQHAQRCSPPACVLTPHPPDA